jgi:pimeloyl-ACP methyl ester carboxylesterase
MNPISAGRSAAAAPSPAAPWQDAIAYGVDAAQRWILFCDTLRRAGNGFLAHENEGCPPVLHFAHETVLDGLTLKRPVNYALLRILPPADAAPPDRALRPFVIIDPRAGHGAGIGGFKSESEVGIALRRGHPVYFVVFAREPAPGQTILDVTAAERAFLAAVRERHPHSPKPVVIGNCQGGWATMMLGATCPELTGPLVLNGAPLSYWAGRRGSNPMRYVGGLTGGGWPAALLADLGNGRFDGAHLALNFENLSPANTWFRKYYDLFDKVDSEAERFVEFDRWWSGFFLMNREEIRWIVDNLFIGNRLARGQVSAGEEGMLDLRKVTSPVIVFASSGDNITPPGQALRWIADVYRDEQEIAALGRRIIYLLHDTVGHLGIFVSGAIAQKEHHEIDSTLDVIDVVAPGLYEMRISSRGDAPEAGYDVELIERTVADIRALSGREEDAAAFKAVARVSAQNAALYETFVGPALRPLVSEPAAEIGRRLHPLRLRRTAISDRNPALAGLPVLAEAVRARRAPAAPDNPFLALERAWAGQVERSLNFWRDQRDAMIEQAFFSIYGTLAAFGIGRDTATAPTDAPAAHAPAPGIADGGYAEALLRIMILLARARGGVRRSRLVRSSALLRSHGPFAAMEEAERQALIEEQTRLVAAAPEESLAALPLLLPRRAERLRALAAVEEVAGPAGELGAAAAAMLARIREVLDLGKPGTRKPAPPRRRFAVPTAAAARPSSPPP